MTITLQPDTLRQLELLKLKTRKSFLGTRQGGHVSLKRGHGIEFSDYRKYELGDDPRHIDWAVYGRNDRLYIKRFQEEQDLSIAIIIDSSASMFTPAEDKKWQRACELALALSYTGLMQQDRVLLLVPGQLDTKFVSGATAFHKLTQSLNKISQPCKTDFIKSAMPLLGRLSHPGLAFVISDFLTPLAENQLLLQGLQSRNLEINAIQILGPNDLNPFEQSESLIAIDSESGEEVNLLLTQQNRKKYALLLAEHNHKLQEYCSRHAISYIQSHSSKPLNEVLVNDLVRGALFGI